MLLYLKKFLPKFSNTTEVNVKIIKVDKVSKNAAGNKLPAVAQSSNKSQRRLAL